MTEARSSSTGGRARAPTELAIRRLSRYDLHCLAVETPARPIHVGILAVLDGTSLLDPAGHLPLADIRRELDGRVAGVPELSRVVFHPGRVAGRRIWVDDPAFEISHHVIEVDLSPPGDETALFALTEQLLAPPLDRSRPLWRMWFVTGLAGGRVALLVVLHHALADGQAAMRVQGEFTLGPQVPDAQLLERPAEQRQDAGHPHDERGAVVAHEFEGRPAQLEAVVEPGEDRLGLWPGQDAQADQEPAVVVDEVDDPELLVLPNRATQEERVP